MPKLRRLLPFALVPVLGTAALAACHSKYDQPSSKPQLGCIDATDCAPNPLGESVVTSAVAPPPVIGGTLTIAENGVAALVSDPDRDRIVVVDLNLGTIRRTTDLPAASEPGRSVEGLDGIAYVALRRAGQIASIDLASGGVITTTNVCGAPRGLAFDTSVGVLHVACAGGELMTLVAGGARRNTKPVGTLTLERSLQIPGGDLRDVVISGAGLLVSHFRSAQIDTINPDGQLLRTTNPGAESFPNFSPTVAWRMIAVPNRDVLVLHQRSATDPLTFADSVPLQLGGLGDTSSSSSSSGGGYDAAGARECRGAAVHSVLTELDHFGNPRYSPNAGTLETMPVPVDVAVTTDGSTVAIVSAGQYIVYEGSLDAIAQRDGCGGDVGPNTGFPGPSGDAVADGDSSRVMPSSKEPIALGYRSDDSLIVQIREPSLLEVHDPGSGRIVKTIQLGGDSRADTGHSMFHGTPDSNPLAVSCASCHPEGRDDGHVWNFTDGSRRTASLAGFSLETAPFHWRGDIVDVQTLVNEIYTGRMGAQEQTIERKTALAEWLTKSPVAPALGGVDAASAERGSDLFNDSNVGCASCHAGPLMTNNATVDVGTNGEFQVPSLRGIALRAPYMHDGCAATLRDRFDQACGGGDAHGHTSQLDEDQITDLISYLETL